MPVRPFRSKPGDSSSAAQMNFPVYETSARM
jgi:hypothetical protein